MIDYHDDYTFYYELCKCLNKEIVQELSIDDLMCVALMQKDRIDMLISQKEAINKSLNSLKRSSNIPLYINIPDFVAIDFETATLDRMACALGIVVVKDYKITQEFYYLIQPPGNDYDQNCIKVHGLLPANTEQEPTFDQIWPNIKHHFNMKIVAHNAAFDVDVLRTNCRYYKIEEPEISAICTCDIHNKTNLPDICCLYDIDINNHHNALEDARACANIFIKYQKIHKVTHLMDKPSSKSRKEKTNDFFSNPRRRLDKEVLKQDLSNVKNKDNIFYDKKVVITGTFKSFPVRQDLAERLKLLGANINTSISKVTDIVVCGDDYGPAKLKKVQELNDAGYPVIIMKEEELITKL